MNGGVQYAHQEGTRAQVLTLIKLWIDVSTHWCLFCMCRELTSAGMARLSSLSPFAQHQVMVELVVT